MTTTMGKEQGLQESERKIFSMAKVSAMEDFEYANGRRVIARQRGDWWCSHSMEGERIDNIDSQRYHEDNRASSSNPDLPVLSMPFKTLRINSFPFFPRETHIRISRCRDFRYIRIRRCQWLRQNMATQAEVLRAVRGCELVHKQRHYQCMLLLPVYHKRRIAYSIGSFCIFLTLHAPNSSFMVSIIPPICQIRSYYILMIEILIGLHGRLHWLLSWTPSRTWIRPWIIGVYDGISSISGSRSYKNDLVAQ